MSSENEKSNATAEAKRDSATSGDLAEQPSSVRVLNPSIWVWAVAAVALIALLDTLLDPDIALLVAAQIVAISVYAIATHFRSPRWPAAVTALITGSALVLVLATQLHGSFALPSPGTLARSRPSATTAPTAPQAHSLTQQAVSTADFHRMRLIGTRLDGLDLRGRNFDGVDASGASFRGALLQGASLRGTILRGSCLRGAHLRGADLTGADLTGADVTGADLPANAPRPSSEGPKHGEPACR